MKPFIIALTLCLFVNISSYSTNDAPIVEPPNGETAGDSNTPTMNEQIRIIIGNASFTATLVDNATAKAFKASLPITVNMTEHAGNEKFYYLPTALPTSTVTPGTIFAGDLMRMYTKYIESKGWKYEITSFSEGTAGGYKEVVMKVTGNNVYGTLKYESGVHRVQRVPQTETQGRVHTSAASVAVLPEAEEFDVEISMNDIRKDIFCASGPGGQSVNTTYSAIRLTHIPTGIVVQCQDQKSQLKNFDKAFEELRTRVFNLEYSKYLDEIASKRKTMVSTGDRSAKIRTYNYPQGRITDHRINYTIYNLSAFMDGDIQDCIDHLIVAENAERLKESEL